MEAAITALTALLTEQGRQIIELSKALAIAHEVHSGVVYPPAPTEPFITPDKLYLSEDEEDELFDTGELETNHITTEMSEILRTVGIEAPVTIA